MIKLIATDLDGSLLDDAKQLPPDFQAVLSQLKEMKIAFAAVSGRNFDAIHPTLGDSVNTMICICNNGANIYEKGVNTLNHPLARNQVHRTLDAVKNMENTVPWGIQHGPRSTAARAGQPPHLQGPCPACPTSTATLATVPRKHHRAPAGHQAGGQTHTHPRDPLVAGRHCPVLVPRGWLWGRWHRPCPHSQYLSKE